MLFPAPTSPREHFRYYRFYSAGEGVGRIAGRLDFAGVAPHQVYFATLARFPTPEELAEAPADPAALYTRLLDSDEYQTTVVDRLLAAFPDKRRLLFVHIPKCAGSDLTMNLVDRHPGLNWRLSQRAWYPRHKMHGYIRRLMDALAFGDSLFVHSHVRLMRFFNNGLIRHGDPLFAVVRDPADMIISKINYILTRFAHDPDLSAPDTKDWARFLDRKQVLAAVESGKPAAIAGEIVHQPKLIQANVLCNFLGNDDAKSAIALCASTDIELTNIGNYERWLFERWGIAKSHRANASQKLMKLADFGEAERRHIDAITAEDRTLLDRIDARLASAGTASIRGAALL